MFHSYLVFVFTFYIRQKIKRGDFCYRKIGCQRVNVCHLKLLCRYMPLNIVYGNCGKTWTLRTRFYWLRILCTCYQNVIWCVLCEVQTFRGRNISHFLTVINGRFMVKCINDIINYASVIKQKFVWKCQLVRNVKQSAY